MRFSVCSDVGGTFSDLIVFDNNTGDWNIFKASTTPHHISDGVMGGLKQAAENYNMSLSDFLAECMSFVHGSTVAINAMIEGKVGKVGLICTKGFRDVLTTGEKGKDNPFQWYIDYPEPYVLRYLTLPVTERINSEGGIEIPLNEDEVRSAVRQLKEWKVEAIGVCLLWSIVNPIHEKRISEIIKEEWPGVSTTISSELNPIIREYRRTSSTAINASLDSVIKDYVAVLGQTLKENGYKNTLSLVTSAGGIISVEEMLKKPIYSFNSGPSMAPVAGLTLAGAERGSKNALTVDMGGTSFDISVVKDGNVILSREAVIKGYFLGIDVVDSISIGAGGGSLARVDSGGLIHVGPESASSEPGPACYGLGSKLPTVTDADVVLGYLDPDYFLGGRIKLNPQLSESAINEIVAKPLNLNLEDAAFTIWSTVNHNMLAAIQDITIRKGIDLREYVLVSGGGAGGMHIQAIAKDLGIKDIIIPKAAAALSAYGGAYADIVTDFSSSCFTESNRFDYDSVNSLLSNLEKKAEEFLLRNSTSYQEGYLEFHAEARYPDQIYELDVPLRTNRIRNEQELSQLVSDFHDVHERIYAVKEPERYIECVHWRIRAVGKTVKPTIRELPFEGESSSLAMKGNRKAYFKELGGLVDTPVYDGKKLANGNELKGPAIIEEPTTTIVVLPGAKVIISKFGNYLMYLE